LFVEPELVNAVFAGEPAPNELRDRTDSAGELIRFFGLPRRAVGCGGSARVDLTDNRGRVLRGGVAARLGQQRWMPAGGIGTLSGTSLRRGTARIPVNRNHFGLGFTRHASYLPPSVRRDCLTAPTLRRSNGTTLQRAYPSRIDDRTQTSTAKIVIEGLERSPLRAVAEIDTHATVVHDPAVAQVVQLLAIYLSVVIYPPKGIHRE